MNKRLIALIIVLIVLIVVLTIMGIFSFFNKNTSKIFELKINESKTINGLTITNKGGGHGILIEGGDLSFTNIELRTSNKKETVIINESEQKLWNGYLITIKEMGQDGEHIKFGVKKVGELKITYEQVFDIVKNYCISQLKVSQEDMNGMQTSSTDKGGYYSVEISTMLGSNKNLYITLEIDKFSGKISRIK